MARHAPRGLALSEADGTVANPPRGDGGLANRDNGVIEVSGDRTLSKGPYLYRDIWKPLARVLDACSIDACEASGWTRSAAIVNDDRPAPNGRLSE